MPPLLGSFLITLIWSLGMVPIFMSLCLLVPIFMCKLGKAIVPRCLVLLNVVLIGTFNL